MTDLLYAGLDFLAAVGNSGFVLFLKILVVLVGVVLIAGTIYVLRAGNYVGLRRQELAWYRGDRHVPEEDPRQEEQEELYVSWQYLYDRLNEEDVDPRKIVLQGEQLFMGALASRATGIPEDPALREIEGQMSLLKRNSHLLISAEEARRMLQVYEQALQRAGVFPSA
jgi:hypothetical protein